MGKFVVWRRHHHHHHHHTIPTQQPSNNSQTITNNHYSTLTTMSYAPPVALLPTPSPSRGSLIQKLHSFLHSAQADPTLSPHIFDAWLFQLTTEDRTTVHEILSPLHNARWPSGVEFPNIIALVHWMQQRTSAAVHAGGDGQEEDDEDCDEEVLKLLQWLEGLSLPDDVGSVSEGESLPGLPCSGSVVVEEPVIAEPATTEPLLADPQAAINRHPEAVHIGALATLVIVFAPGWLVRVLLAMFVLLLRF
jgi:hypothetical protein